MKQTRDIMGMPIVVEIVDEIVSNKTFEDVFDYFEQVDKRYSTYKPHSEISQINQGLSEGEWSSEMSQVLELCEETKQATNGYFDIRRGGQIDPSGLVKGWAIQNAAQMLQDQGFFNYYISAGGDIAVSGHNSSGKPWRVGVRNPFNRDEIIKVLELSSGGVATSGTYIRGQHVYNPHQSEKPLDDVASITVVGPSIYDADRYATAAFAMGRAGIEFIENLDDHEAYMVDTNAQAFLTSNFDNYVLVA